LDVTTGVCAHEREDGKMQGVRAFCELLTLLIFKSNQVKLFKK
jgi:hypothetical protein